ncbi:ankyrin repeat and death domain-containing protein 1A-like [Formica exsecta]|uniref:ankyrin repeat and death domain-containing protein 1A-like n=1 Tax=Formica exsecta TaxID=72781 RepID=UPI00114176ED|nr:ankyrin repeat and death domain-containing protein 1A-like [Formica exsecta]
MVDKEELSITKAKAPPPLNLNEAIEDEVLNQKTARILKNDLLLHEAVIKNEADTVRKVLKETVDVDSRNNYGRAPIHWAASRGNTEIIEMLMLAKCDIEARDKYGMRPLHMAAQHGHRDAVKMLINAGANVSAVNKKQYTLLMCGARGSNVSVVEYLAEAVESLNGEATDSTGATALHHAAISGHPAVITAVANIPQIILDATDKKGQTPMHYACAEEHLEAVEVLIGLGVNVDAQDNDGNTPLHVATRTRHTGIAQLLLKAGANTELTDAEGFTPLHVAASQGCKGILDSMIQHGADLNKQCKEISNSDKEVRELTPARRRWREGSCGGSISSNNGRLSEQVRSILWKLAYKQLAPGDWKKLALHWAFTPEQIKAIEHQYTEQLYKKDDKAPIVGSSSYKEHGFRMLMIWTSGLNPDVQLVKELCDALSAVDKKTIADSIRKQMEQGNGSKAKSKGQRCHKCCIA